MISRSSLFNIAAILQRCGSGSGSGKLKTAAAAAVAVRNGTIKSWTPVLATSPDLNDTILRRTFVASSSSSTPPQPTKSDSQETDESSASTPTTTTTAAAPTSIPPNIVEPKAANPGNFLRGEGPYQHPKDMKQELYWKLRHNIIDDQGNPVVVETGGDGNKKEDSSSFSGQQQTQPEQQQQEQSHELPSDLIQFLQDVGPLKRSLDTTMSSPRVVQEQEEIDQGHRHRPLRRERISMPLLGDDEEFTAVRNTNFARKQTEESTSNTRFGTTGTQLYGLLKLKQQQQQQHKASSSDDDDAATIVESFYKKHTSNLMQQQQGDDDGDVTGNDDLLPWTAEEQEFQKTLLKRALQVIELPVLMKDSDGNFMGLASKQVPGQEVKSIQPVPPTKLKLVVEDWIDRQQRAQMAIEERRQSRRNQRRGERRR